MNTLEALRSQGQSVWLDFIRRRLMTSGELERLRDQGLRGLTSNPTIFDKAITGSSDYDETLNDLGRMGKNPLEIYEALAIEDIRRAAALMRPVFEESEGMDGFVSFEVSPHMAHHMLDTVAEAERLKKAVGHPNVMIKIPATPEGIAAIEVLIARGINVNATLIFSVGQYEAVANAYIAGIEKLDQAGGNLSGMASVASFFISRVDVQVDEELEGSGYEDLKGTIAIASATAAYARFRELFSQERWKRLAAKGARVQRPLWASTSVKNSMYPDTLYVDSLVGPDTVNTMPPVTLQAVLDHGSSKPVIEEGIEKARGRLLRLKEAGIDLGEINDKLLKDAVSAFSASFDSLLESIARKIELLQTGWKDLSVSLADYAAGVEDARLDLSRNQVIRRIWAHDHTVWKSDPAEIANRLGWLHSAELMRESLEPIMDFAEAVKADGFKHVLLLGMGGSSLAPEVMRKTFGIKPGFLDLAVLDSTAPEAVLSHAENLDLARTLFIVSTKSGGTVETMAFFKYFYNRVKAVFGTEGAGSRFVAITDPGSGLAELARRYGFRRTFLNDPNIGGRYSALSYFGLLPAALIGVDLGLLLDRAIVAACSSDSCVESRENPAVYLGAILGELAVAGRDKVTFAISPAIESFGEWVEQLLAESTGKEGKGILPVVSEPLGPPSVYGQDRLFIHLKLAGDTTHDAGIEALEKSGQPVVSMALTDTYDLGKLFFTWELATAVAGHRLGINPFDQPNVEAAKVKARGMIKAYLEQGTLPETEPAWSANGVRVFGNIRGGEPHEVLSDVLKAARPGAYVAFQAYLPPGPEISAALRKLSLKVRDRYHMATTVGYGPRFLHSTGQLHKGDSGKGIFVQITADTDRDIGIPDEVGAEECAVSFGVLKAAQAIGDYRALEESDRRVIRFHFARDAAAGLRRIAEALH